MAKTDLTAARLREILNYNPETGVFTRRCDAHKGRHKAGKTTGSRAVSGYMVIKVDGVTRLAHRLAWMHVHGEWPKQHIDHINGDKADNRLANLRDVSRSVNMQNRRTTEVVSASGYLGVSWSGERRKWEAKLGVGGRTVHAGRHETPEEAHAAYLTAKRRLHEGCTI